MDIPFKILDLFAGPGGLSLGFELVKYKGKRIYELYKAVEIDNHACNTLKRNFGEIKVIKGDLTLIETHEKIINECKSNNGNSIDLVTAGIPCQSFSLLGSRSGINNNRFDYRDTLYLEFYKIVKELKPMIFLIENVKGILSKKDKDGNKIIDNITSLFEKIGYRLDNNKNSDKYLLLDAVNYGVPQRRQRVFIIGFRKDLINKPIPYPEQQHYFPEFKNGLSKFISISAAIGDLPPVLAKYTFTDLTSEQIEKIKKCNSEIERAKLNGQDKLILKNENKEEYDLFLESISKYPEALAFQKFVRNSDIIYGHISRSQQKSDIELFDKIVEGWTSKDIFTEKYEDTIAIKRLKNELKPLIKYCCTKSFTDKYRKQEWNEPSTTIFAHLQKDGNRFIHPKQARTFTPREAARLQSFPDSFVFEGPMTQQFRQIGNAVPPLLAKAIGEALIKCLFS